MGSKAVEHGFRLMQLRVDFFPVCLYLYDVHEYFPFAPVDVDVVASSITTKISLAFLGKAGLANGGA
jgi:hypothetical protein